MLPGGYVLPWGYVLAGGRGDACFQGGLLPGGGIPACTESDPPVNRITDMSKNITLATTSLWPVITSGSPCPRIHTFA